MPTFDQKCDLCGHRWEVYKAWEDLVDCPECGSHDTDTLMPRVQGLDKAKDPFDLVGMGQKIPDSKKTKSFANDRRRGGKDTT